MTDIINSPVENTDTVSEATNVAPPTDWENLSIKEKFGRAAGNTLMGSLVTTFGLAIASAPASFLGISGLAPNAAAIFFGCAPFALGAAALTVLGSSAAFYALGSDEDIKVMNDAMDETRGARTATTRAAAVAVISSAAMRM